MEKKVDFYKVRDFGQIFGDAVSFLKENARGIGRSVVMIVAPAYTLASVAFSFFSMRMVENIFTLKNSGSNGDAAQEIAFLFLEPTVWLSMLLFFIAYLLAVGTIYSYIKLYSQRADNYITPVDVWKELSSRLAKFFFFTIGYGVIIGFAAVIIMLISSVLTLIPFLGVLINLAITIGMQISLIALMSVLVPVIFYEDLGFMESLSRAMNLLRGAFFKTAGVNFVASLIVQFAIGIIAVLFIVPTIIIGVSSQSLDPLYIKILLIVALVIIPVVVFFSYIFQYSVSSLNYFSLLEAADHVGLRKRVEDIGATNDDRPEEQY